MIKKTLFVLLLVSTNCFAQYYKTYDWRAKPKMHSISSEEEKEHLEEFITTLNE